MTDLFDVRKRMKELRLEKKLTQSEIAERLGTTMRQLQNWEYKKNTFPAERIPAICEALGVTPNTFFGLDDRTAARLAIISTELAQIEEDVRRDLNMITVIRQNLNPISSN